MMVDKQAGILNDRLLWGQSIEKTESNLKVVKKLEPVSRLSLRSYLKLTFRQRKNEFIPKKMTCKQLTQSHYQQQHDLILTMRTQYEARPHS